MRFTARRATAAELEREGITPPPSHGEEGKNYGKEQAVLEVVARVCRSVLVADITELQFLEARPGMLYVKEFSVWNK